MVYNPKDKNPSGVVLFGNNGSDQVFESVTDFVYDTGNTRLGINTSSPQYTLDVSGTGAFHTIRFADGTEMITSGGGGGGTTYTAGSGLILDGTEFNVFGGSGNFQYIELKSSTQDPQIYFLGSGSNDTPITLNILSSYQSASSSGSALVFDGTEGQLFAITDNLSSGVIFSVADIAGLPLIEADASGDVQLIEFGRYVGVGTGTPQYQLDVFGTGRFSDGVIFPDGNRQTIAYTGGAGGGGGSPGGSVNQIQINDGAGGFTAATNSDRFVYDDSTNTFDLGRQSADNVAGGQFTNYWFANNFCVGGGNFSATMDSDANNNTAVGIDALGALTFGDDNVAIGYQAGDALTASDDNTIIGSQAGSAFGNNINDNRNVIIGYQAANAATDIASNVIIGYQAGLSAAGPDGSVIIGAQAGYDSDADYNVLIGYQCGYKADGNYNIYIGKPQSSDGGAPNVTGSGNLILGWNFDPSNNAIHGLPNGYSSTASEQFAIANSLVGDFSAQRIGVGEAAINALDATLHVIPQNSSDVVLKVEGAAAQSANLQEWRNSSDTELASVGPSGRLYYQSSYSPISNEGTASSFTFDLGTSNVFSGTLSAASTLTTSNGDVGQRFLVRLKQGSGGSKTVSSWFGGRVSWPGGSAPTLSSTAGHVDLFGFLVTSGTAPTLYYDGFTIATGIQ